MNLITIWGDESSQNGHRFMVLGTIWEEYPCSAELEKDAKKLREDFYFHREFHWNEMNKFSVNAYKGLVDLFYQYMKKGALRFHSLIVDMSEKKNVLKGDDPETHFYKMFYWLIYKRLRQDRKYDIFLDRKSNSVPGRLKDLEQSLNRRMIQDYLKKHFEDIKKHKPFFTHHFPRSAEVVRRVESRDGSQIQLQMADVFAGAIAYVRNGFYEKAKINQVKNGKACIVDYIQTKLGVDLHACHSSHEQIEFNLWCFQRK